jgi:hypothetical protein
MQIQETVEFDLESVIKCVRDFHQSAARKEGTNYVLICSQLVVEEIHRSVHGTPCTREYPLNEPTGFSVLGYPVICVPGNHHNVHMEESSRYKNGGNVEKAPALDEKIII